MFSSFLFLIASLSLEAEMLNGQMDIPGTANIFSIYPMYTQTQS